MNLLTTEQAAAELGVTRNRVLVLIGESRLPAERVGHQWLIRRADLAKVRHRKTGRPKKAKG